MALGTVKNFYDCPSQPIGIIWFVVSLFTVSCLDPFENAVTAKALQVMSMTRLSVDVQP